jgi:hypothetical protein
LYDLKETIQNKLNKLHGNLNSHAAIVENAFIERIRSGNITKEFLSILTEYVLWYNEFKIQTNQLDEVNILINGVKSVKNIIMPETKMAKSNLILESGNEFLRRRGGWIIRYNNKQEFVLSSYVGLTYIAYLLERPNEIHHCKMLIDLENERENPFENFEDDIYKNRSQISDEKIEIDPLNWSQNQQQGIEPIDAKTRRDYKKRINILKLKLKNPSTTDIERKKHENEIKDLEYEIEHGGPRGLIKSNDDTRNKKSVAKAIADARYAISMHDEELAQHLKKSISSGINVVYESRENISWTIERTLPKRTP